MKKLSFILILIFAFCTANAAAADTAAGEQFGIGLIVGEPTGVSMKYRITENSAFDLGVAWSFANEDAFHIHSDYLIHNFNLIKVPEGQLPFYYGIGARVKFAEDDKNKNRDKDGTIFGARIPLGLSYMFANQPIDIFGEIVPVLDLVPDTDFALNIAVGARYFF
ncbi:MAG: DUF3996 domain-containing protein [Spirochaetes bacterium]|nr:DUF3996 domain-containing protein [Spirochaetota bacterium]